MADIPARDRRSFLKFASAASASAVAFGVDVDGLKLPRAFAQAAAADVGSGEFGVLNFAYALEQLEAAFYTQVLTTPYRGMSEYELQVLTGIRDHEVAHRETFRLALNIFAIPDLTPNFSRVNFASRVSVLGTARAFEDLGVSAYNGGGVYLSNPLFLALAGSIVSVEARHAALIRDMLHPHSTYFAGDDTVDRAGLDVVRVPSQVLPIAAPYIATPVTASQLP
jgi:hypothetical protein